MQIRQRDQNISNILNLIIDTATIWKMNESMKTANSPFWRRLEGRNLETFFNFPKRFMTDTIILLYVTLHHHWCTTIAITNKRTAKVPGPLDEGEMAEGNHPQTITLQSMEVNWQEVNEYRMEVNMEWKWMNMEWRWMNMEWKHMNIEWRWMNIK